MYQTNYSKRLRSCLAISLLLVVAGCEINIGAEELVARANSSLQQGDAQAASLDLKSALQKEPRNAEARLLLGQAYLDLGDPASAEKELRTAMELGAAETRATLALTEALLLQGKTEEVRADADVPDDMPVEQKARMYLLRGKAALDQGDVFGAGMEFQYASSSAPESADALQGEAIEAMTAENWSAARDRLERANAAGGENSAEVWELLGDLERIQGREAEAIEAYTAAIDARGPQFQPRVKRALALVATRQYERADEEIAQLRKVNPRHPGVNYVAGLSQLFREDFPAAQAEFEKTLASQPEHPFALYYIGAAHLAQNQFGQAEQSLRRALAVNPTSEETAKLLAAVELSTEDPDEAQRLLRPLLNSNPEDPILLRLLGRSYVGQGKRTEGIELLEKALSLEPDPSTQAQLGLTLIQQGELEQGLDHLAKAIAAEPGSNQLETSYFITLMQNGQADRALAEARSLAEQRPEDPLPLSLIGAAHIIADEPKQAREALNAALELEAGSPLAANLLARMELLQGNIGAAREYYRQVLQHHPEHLLTLIQNANIAARTGNVDEARIDLEKAVAAHPKAFEPRLMLVSLYASTDQAERGIRLLTEVENDFGDDPRLRVALGKLYLSNQQASLALRQFRSLSQLAPEWPEAHYLLAQALVATGDREQAKQELLRVLEMDSGLVRAEIALIQLLVLENDKAEAEQRVSKLAKQHPSHPAILALQGWFYGSQGRARESAEAYRAALATDPSEQFAVQLATQEWLAGNRQQSVETLTDWLVRHPDDLQVKYSLGSAYLSLNETDKAIDIYQKIVAQQPTSALAYNNLAWLLRTADQKRALQHAQKALALAPRDPRIMDTTAMLLLDNGESARAVRLLEQAHDLDTDNHDIALHLAQALSQNGDNDRAREVLEEFTATDMPAAVREQIDAGLRELE